MKLTVKDTQGHDRGEVSLSFQPVEESKGNQAVHDVVVAYMAAQRSGTACTKTMGDVAGSGKKPWRQKGTGRARAGSFASPLWRGGGVVFGPKPRDFTKKVSKKTRNLALRKAWTERLKAGDVIVIEDLKLDSPKTKGFTAVLKGLNLSGPALIVAATADQNLERASRNVPGVEVVHPQAVNTYQLLRFKHLVFTRDAVQVMDERLQSEGGAESGAEEKGEA